MGQPPDENLPEVFIDTSPQALTHLEAQYKQREHDDRDKYPVVFDGAPKILNDVTQYSAMSPNGSVPWEPLSAVDGSINHNLNKSPDSEKTICGLRRKTFFIALVAALIVIAGAIGGGVGGSIAAARTREGSGGTAAAASTSSNSSTTGPTTTGPTTTGSTTTGSTTIANFTSTSSSSSVSATPTFLNNQTGPLGFAFQGFSGVNYTGEATPVYREEGFFNLGMNCNSYVWLPNTTSCCLTFCANTTTATGYWCQARKRERSSGSFPRIYIYCGLDPEESGANKTCS